MNLEAALHLARNGAFVFPCQSSGSFKKNPCKGVYWRAVSANEEEKVKQLWVQHPTAMPGLDVGKTGWLIVDCDMKRSDGIAWFTMYAQSKGDDLSSVPYVQTPSGGRHYVFKNPNKHGNGRGLLPPKAIADLDIRGNGGYVIGAGALLSEGGDYKAQGDIFNPPDPPQWLTELLSPPKPEPQPISVRVTPDELTGDRMRAYGLEALDQEFRSLASMQSGERNDSANRIAFRIGQLVGGKCLSYTEAYESLAQAALSWGIRPNDKALGPRGTIARAIRDGERSPRGPQESDIPTVEILLDGSPIDAKTGEVLTPQNKQHPDELPHELANVPGLVGEIANWITDTALYPQPGLSLGAALAVIGTAAGRHVSGPNRCGTHLYIVGLAPSGAGKNHPLSQISTILAASEMRAHIGPSQFISMPAVINFLVRSPLSVCAMDEFGAFLKRINNRRASGFEGAISGLLRTAWGASFSAMSTPEWAQRSSETIFSPAMSIYGVSTAREFYDSLEGADVTNGVLNRFLVIETKIRPKERPPLRDASQVPESIIRGVKAIYNRNPLAAAQLCQSRQAPPFYTIPITPDAEQIRRGLVEEINAKGDADSSLEPFMARTAENALRLASIVAVGTNPTKPQIDAATMTWARAFSVWSTERLAQGAGLYIADSDTQAAANAVRRAVQAGGGRISRQALIRALQHKYKSRELDDVIKMLAEAEQIVVEKLVAKEGGAGRPGYFYSVPTLQ